MAKKYLGEEGLKQLKALVKKDITEATDMSKKPIILTKGVHYGDTLPSTGEDGQLFFLKIEENDGPTDPGSPGVPSVPKT